MADEDVTVLGEELQRLGDRTVEGLDEAGRVDYQTALDAYESAKRAVPACAQDAARVARVARGETPQIRSVKVGASLAPYWEAGAAYLPYGRAYFSTAVLESGYRAHGPDSWGGGISI